MLAVIHKYLTRTLQSTGTRTDLPFLKSQTCEDSDFLKVYRYLEPRLIAR